MNRTGLTLALVCVIFVNANWGHADNWPGWRGDGSGISSEKDLPLTWSEQENVKWKMPIPGTGHSSPIVWDKNVFVTTAVAADESVESFKGGVYMGGDRKKPDDSEYAYCLLCLDTEDGSLRWSKTVLQQKPKTRRHTKNTYASETPVTDGKCVFAAFGSAGLYCVDFAGNLVWQRDLGRLRVRTGWGTGSSPVLYRNTVIVNCDSDDDSYITALDKNTGEPVWKSERDEGASWSTPFLVETQAQTVVVTNARKRMRGYSADTGRLLWECAGGSMITVPSAVSSKDMVFLASGHSMSLMRQPIVAIRADASGNITPARGQTQSDGVIWLRREGGPYVTSPIALGDYLYMPLDKGTLTCYEAETGKVVYEKQRLAKRNTITASPIACDGKIYVQTEDGECHVIKPGPQFEILAVNKLDEVFCASPAASEGKLFLRGRKHLYCITK